MTDQIEPPKINLGVDDYRVQTRRGRWIVRDNWLVFFLWCAPIALFFIGWGWWHRDEIAPASLYGLCAMVSFAFGIGIGGWLKRFD